MGLESRLTHGQRAYRKAAWAIEDTAQDLGLIHRQMGLKGLESADNVRPRLGTLLEDLLAEVQAGPEDCARPGPAWFHGSSRR